MANRKEGFEEHLKALEKLVDELEHGDLTLDQALERFEDGVKRLKTCRELLQTAEEKVKILVRDAQGELKEEPFESEGA
ncbi:MAG TPA: exodeoxyribonuclease VII small subunit [Planctomycetota bacterium]|nr:exodeoxyribonuclease VII small subunit [Planctomycetota bacterium]